MQIFLIAFFFLLLITTIMAVGVLFGRKPITGSCGGVGAALGEKDYVCDLCGNDESKCEELNAEGVTQQAESATKKVDNFYQADRPLK